MDMKSLLEDDNFLIGMGLLSAGAKGQSIGEAGITSIKDAAAIKKSLIGKTKDKFRLLSRTEIENNAALDNNSNYQMNMTTGELKIVPINKVAEKKQKDQFRLLSKDEVITDYPALDPNKTYQLNETTGKVELFKKESAKMFETKYEAGLGTQASENVKKIRLDGENAIEANTNLNLINSIAEDLNTGAGANILQNIAKWGQRFDIDLNWLSDYAQDKTVSNSEILQVLSSAQLFAAISQTKGSISEKEMAVFEGITTNLAMSKAGIQGNIKIQEAINNRRILAFYHVIWAFMMILTPITSYDKYILFFHLSLILLTLATRKIFNGCIVRNLESNNEKITNNSFTKLFNWDLIFPILGFISNYKLFTLDTIKFIQ